MKIAFTGAGYIINIHAQAAAQQQDVELFAIVNRSSEKTRGLMRKFNIQHQFETVEQLLAAGGVDVLVVGTPNYLHASQAITALKAGVHVMVEKPMAMNAQEACQMLAASRESGSL